MAKYVRFRGGVILRHPETGMPFVPTSDPIEENDPIVKANRHAFASDEEMAAEAANPVKPPTEVKVERATKRPGEKRDVKKS